MTLKGGLRTDPDGRECQSASLRGIFEHTFELMGLVAPDGTLLDANRRALELAGVAREEVVGRPFWDTPWWTHDPALAARLRSSISEAADGRFVRFEATHRLRDGRLAVVDFSLTPVLDDQRKVILIVPEGRDITDRKRAEQWQAFLADAGALLATSLDYEQTLHNVAALAVQSLADCCIVDLADDDGTLRRVTVAHAAADRPWFVGTLESVTLDQSRPHLARTVFETGGSVLLPRVPSDFVYALVQHDEHRRALQALDIRSLMAVPLHARGRVLGALTFLASAGGREYGPDDLRLAQDLGHRAALAVENAKLYRVAQDAIRARQDVLGIVAHDLRSPIAAIRMAATAHRRLLPDGSDDGLRETVDLIVRAAERAERLVKDLLEVRRIAAGHLAVERERVDARSLLAQCLEDHRYAASAASLQLVIDAPGELRAVWADRHRVRQVFENLIGNAIKFTPAGGRITVGAHGGDGEVIFRVSDTGVGIARELLPRLFDDFWQARVGDDLGVGLGLSIAKEVIDAHGGRVWAESAPGAGSTFYFSIPHDQ